MASKKQKNSYLNLAISAAIVIVAFWYFSDGFSGSEKDKQQASGNPATDPSAQQPTFSPDNLLPPGSEQTPGARKVTVSLDDIAKERAAEQARSQDGTVVAPDQPPLPRREDLPADLPEDMVRSLTNPPPPLPPDLQAQLNAPPPELPEDLKKQLMQPKPELPDDLKAQLNATPPEVPQDILDSLNTPPRIVTPEEVNIPE